MQNRIKNIQVKNIIILFCIIFLVIIFNIKNSNADLTTVDIRKPKLIIFLHGIHEQEKRTNRRFKSMLKYFKRQGYYVNLMHYNSKDSFNNIVENLNERIQKEVDFKKYNVYIIAHSMGGIVAHYLITDYNLPINSVVMISTPINGSAMANYYSKGILSIFGNIIMGKPLKSISPDNEVIKNITNINYNVGMIISHKNKFAFSIISNLILNGENDGVVAVEEMKKEGIKDYTYINENHISVLYSPTTHKQAQLFLEEDHFKH